MTSPEYAELRTKIAVLLETTSNMSVGVSAYAQRATVRAEHLAREGHYAAAEQELALIEHQISCECRGYA